MPEVDLTNKLNRKIFIDWRQEKFALKQAEEISLGVLDNGEFIYVDRINGEPVNTFADSEERSVLPEAFRRADVSDKHADELRDRGLIFDSKADGIMPISEIKRRLDAAARQIKSEIRRLSPRLVDRMKEVDHSADFLE